MTAKPIEQQKYTVDDLLSMPNDGKRYELVEGEIVEMGTSSQKHSILGAWLVFMLLLHIKTSKLGGRVSGADGTYRLDEDNTKTPDVSYIKATSAAKVPPGSVYCPFAPDFAIEIKSPRDSGAYLRRLAALYMRTGTQLLWVIDPDDKTVTVYRPRELAIELTEGITDASDVILGFKIDLAEMFVQIENL